MNTFSLRWFTTYPEIRPIFKSFSRYATLEEALVSKELLLHAKKLQAAVEAVVRKVDKRKELVELLVAVGRSHFGIGAQQTHATVSLSFDILILLLNLSQ